jgi:phosphoglycerol transferase MdoB-like AlkP superfamily enzyme
VGAGNTSDAEFAINNSIFGTGRSFTYKLFDKNTFRGLPVLLREQGYATAVFHAFHDRNYWNRESFYKAGGFAQYYGGLSEEGKGGYALTESFGWGLVDSAFFAQSIPYIKSLPEPFYSFMITLSNHHPFQLPNTLRHTINLLPEDDNIVGHYLQSVNYTDFCLGQFIDELKKAGLYENSLIAIYGDHQGLVMEEKIISAMSRLLGRPYDYDILLNVPLIIVLPEETAVQPTVAHTAGGQIDFLPTIAYLLGLEALDVHLGHNLLTIDQGFVATQSYMLKGSFIENDIAFEMSRDGVFAHSRAWNRKTLEEVDLAFCYANYKKALDLIDAADYILDHDLMASNGHP